MMKREYNWDLGVILKIELHINIYSINILERKQNL